MPMLSIVDRQVARRGHVFALCCVVCVCCSFFVARQFLRRGPRTEVELLRGMCVGLQLICGLPGPGVWSHKGQKEDRQRHRQSLCTFPASPTEDVGQPCSCRSTALARTGSKSCSGDQVPSCYRYSCLRPEESAMRQHPCRGVESGDRRGASRAV